MSAPIIRVADMAFPALPRARPRPDGGVPGRPSAWSARHGRPTPCTCAAPTPQHHVHVTHLGEPAFLGLAFQAASRRDLATLAEATGTRVEALDEPGGGEVVHLTDPDGRSIDVVHGIEPARRRIAPRPPAAQHGCRPPPGRDAAARADRTGPGEALRTRRHQDDGPGRALALVSRDARPARLGRHLHGRPRAADRPFLRCDRGAEPADHHTLLLLETPEAKLGHVAWEVADFDDLMVGHDHLLANGPAAAPTGASAATSWAARSSTTGRTRSASPSSTGPTATSCGRTRRPDRTTS